MSSSDLAVRSRRCTRPRRGHSCASARSAPVLQRHVGREAEEQHELDDGDGVDELPAPGRAGRHTRRSVPRARMPTSEPNQKALQSAAPGRCWRSISRPNKIIAAFAAKMATTAARSRMPTNSPIRIDHHRRAGGVLGCHRAQLARRDGPCASYAVRCTAGATRRSRWSSGRQGEEDSRRGADPEREHELRQRRAGVRATGSVRRYDAVTGSARSSLAAQHADAASAASSTPTDDVECPQPPVPPRCLRRDLAHHRAAAYRHCSPCAPAGHYQAHPASEATSRGKGPPQRESPLADGAALRIG